MLDHARRQSFKESIAGISEYLELKFGDSLKLLPGPELRAYKPGHQFVRGWSFLDLDARVRYKVLIPQQFPYATVRIAIEDADDPSRDFGKDIPHVEERGLLCLPTIEPFATEAVAVLNKMLGDAFRLVATYSNDRAESRREFQREFLSYWNRQRNGAPILSLVDVTGDTRQIFFGEGRDPYWIAADSLEDIYRWHWNKHQTDKRPAVLRGLFIKLAESPAPPFPKTPAEFDAFIEKHAPQELDAFRVRMLYPGPYLIVMASESETGIGTMGVSFLMPEGAPNPLRGFRGTVNMSTEVKMNRFDESYRLRRHQIFRVDHDWIHGRGVDTSQEHLKKASVTILGCGALGSHVAIRLAQAGIGSFFLIDPELLEPPNIGRHTLGMNNLLSSKAGALAKEIRQRFPHVKVQYFMGKWEEALLKYPSAFESATLIVSAIASWGSEGALNEWHVSRSTKPPILYGWTEQRAVAAHAVLIQAPGTCFHCLIRENGRVRAPETEGWPNEDGDQFEPACGALFQPFGPVELASAEALTTDLVIGVLTGEVKRNMHMVHATNEERVHALGGQWSSTHRQHRPRSFVGSFQYERPMSKHPDCPYCSKYE